MGWYPCCCNGSPPRPGPPFPTPGDPPPGDCTHPGDCLTEPDCTGFDPSFDYAGCSQCVTISLTFSSDTDPMGCPCDIVKSLPNAIAYDPLDSGVCGPWWAEEFTLDTGAGCTPEAYIAVAALPLLGGTNGASIAIYRAVGTSWILVASMSVATPDPSECRDYTYNFSSSPGISIDGTYCLWTDASVAFDACT